MDRDRNIDVIDKKMSIFCRTQIAVGQRIQGGSPGRLRLRYAVGLTQLPLETLTFRSESLPAVSDAAPFKVLHFVYTIIATNHHPLQGRGPISTSLFVPG